jgi:hypothetical protein
MAMLARMPDLLWEIRTGQRVSGTNKPGGVVYTVAAGVYWLVLPLVWYSLCRWNYS